MAKREFGVGVATVQGAPVVKAFEVRDGKEITIDLAHDRKTLDIVISALESLRAHFPEQKPTFFS